ncbi:hypothetical protein AGMMS50222_01080 [Endomicrobiia bacterium]|nr:hypothetical protein AGMMS49531_03470 [Endomicrobiia bacterium]GHT73492.1 hypothetical protein AGMMS50222_01080 [Endomicrobiia bacterium]
MQDTDTGILGFCPPQNELKLLELELLELETLELEDELELELLDRLDGDEKECTHADTASSSYC